MTKPFIDHLAERVLLRALLLYSEFRDSVLPRIRPEFFAKPSHQRIFRAIIWSHATYGQQLEKETFIRRLQKGNLPEDKRLKTILAWEAVEEEKSRLSPQMALDTLKDLYQKRRLYEIASGLVDRLAAGSSGEEIVLKTRTHLDNLVMASAIGEVIVRTPADSVDDRKAEYEDMEQNPEKYRGRMFGIDELDKITNGIQPEEICLIVGRQGSGKTRVLFNIAYNVSREAHVVFFTIEMPEKQIQRIYTSRDAMLDYLKLKTATLTPDEKTHLFEVLERQRVTASKFHIVDMARGCSTSAVEAQLRMLMSAYPIKLAVIDYVGLMESSRRWKEPWKEVEQIGRELKQIARVLHVPIVTAAQATREMAKALKEEEEIGLEHVALSDRLADHADMVIIIHQSKGDTLGNIIHWQVEKHRDGTKIRFDTFADMAHQFIGNRVIELSVGKQADDTAV